MKCYDPNNLDKECNWAPCHVFKTLYASKGIPNYETGHKTCHFRKPINCENKKVEQ